MHTPMHHYRTVFACHITIKDTVLSCMSAPMYNQQRYHALLPCIAEAQMRRHLA